MWDFLPPWCPRFIFINKQWQLKALWPHTVMTSALPTSDILNSLEAVILKEKSPQA